MVGLIPNTTIIHLVGSSKPITETLELIDQAEAQNIEFIISHETQDLKATIRKYRPEILLIEESVFLKNLDSVDITYRSKSCQPFKLVYVEPGKSKEEVFSFFRQGADDVISKSASVDELLIKIISILRRKTVLEQNQLTGLPAVNRTYTVLEHCLNKLSDWAVVHVDIMYFQSYTTMYGVARADNVIAETAKLLVNSLKELTLPEYFLGHLGRDNFVIVSNTNNFEEIIFKIKKDFKSILAKLYKKSDYDNGYIISSASNHVRRKEGLLTLNLGYCTNIDRNFLSGTDVIEQCVKNKKNSELKNKRVLILEDDQDFASLLEETLIREGSEAKIATGLDNLINEVEEFEPRTLILEASKLGPQNFIPLCASMDRFKDEFGLKILVATNVPGYQNFLAYGADVYIPKPYDLEILLKEVRRLRYTHV